MGGGCSANRPAILDDEELTTSKLAKRVKLSPRMHRHSEDNALPVIAHKSTGVRFPEILPTKHKHPKLVKKTTISAAKIKPRPILKRPNPAAEKMQPNSTEWTIDVLYQLKRLTILLAVTHVVSESLQGFYQKQMESIQAVLDTLKADRATIFVADKEKRQLWSKIAKDSDEIRIPDNAGIAGHVYTTGATINIQDAYLDDRFNPDNDMKTGYRTQSLITMAVPDPLGNTIAVIQVINKLAGPHFTDEDELALQSLCITAGVQLYQAHLYEELHEAQQSTAVLQEVACAISKELDMYETMVRIVNESSEKMNADRATLFIADKARKELWSLLAKGSSYQVIKIPDNVGIAGKVYQTGKAINLPDAYASEDFNRDTDLKSGYRTRQILCMPVRLHNGTTMGVLQVINKRDGMPFSREDEMRLKEITVKAGIRLRYAQLYQSAFKPNRELSGRLAAVAGTDNGSPVYDLLMRQITEAEFKRRWEQKPEEVRLRDNAELIAQLKRCATLLAFTHTISEALQNLDQSMEKIIREVCEQLRADRASLFISDGKGNLWSKVAKDSKEVIKFGDDKGIAGHVFQTGSTVNIQDAYRDERFNPENDKRTGYKTRSMLCMAIPDPRGIGNIAVIQVLNKRDGTGVFTHEDESKLEIVAIQAGLNLHHAQLFEAFVAQIRRSVPLGTVTNRIMKEMSVSESMKRVMREAREKTEAEEAMFYIRDTNPGQLWFKYENTEARIPNNKGLVGQCFRSQETINCPNVLTEARFKPEIDARCVAKPYNMLLLPVINSEAESVGVLQVLNKRGGGPFTEEDEAKLKGITTKASLSIKYARLFQDAFTVRRTDNAPEK